MKLKDLAERLGVELPVEVTLVCNCSAAFMPTRVCECELKHQDISIAYDNIELPIEKLKPSRTYPIVCSSCGGLGYITNPLPVCSSTTIICPACNGSKTVMAVENNINQEGSDET